METHRRTDSDTQTAPEAQCILQIVPVKAKSRVRLTKTTFESQLNLNFSEMKLRFEWGVSQKDTETSVRAELCRTILKEIFCMSHWNIKKKETFSYFYIFMWFSMPNFTANIWVTKLTGYAGRVLWFLSLSSSGSSSFSVLWEALMNRSTRKGTTTSVPWFTNWVTISKDAKRCRHTRKYQYVGFGSIYL